MIWRFILSVVEKLTGGFSKGVDEILTVTPLALWRKAVVLSILLILGGLWLVYDKVNCETVDKKTWAASCEASDKKLENFAGQVKEDTARTLGAITELKEEIVGYRKDRQQEDRDRIKFLEGELEKSRRHNTGTR